MDVVLKEKKNLTSVKEKKKKMKSTDQQGLLRVERSCRLRNDHRLSQQGTHVDIIKSPRSCLVARGDKGSGWFKREKEEKNLKRQEETMTGGIFL